MKFYESEQKLVNLTDIRLGYNPRSSLGDLTSLKQSIQQVGLLDPITLRPNGHKDDKKPYELVCGHRRYKSFEELNILQIPSNIRELTDEEAFHIAFIDNKERENHNSIDEARHYKKAQLDYDLSTRGLAEKYGEMGNGESYKYYQRKLNLLELPEEIQNKIGTSMSQLTETHCIHICKLLNKDKLQKKFEELYNIEKKEWNEPQIERYNKELDYRQQIQINLANSIIENSWSVKKAEKKAIEFLDELKERDNNLDEEIEEKKKEFSLLDNIYFKSSWKMQELKNNSIPLIITSPDYWAKKEYENYKNFDGYKKNLRNTFNECKRVLCPGGRLCINIGDIPNLNGNGVFIIGCFLQDIFKKSDIKLIDKIIWKKDDPWVNNPHIRFDGMEGKYRILPSTEYVFIFKKEGKREIKPSVKIKGGLSKDEWKQYSSGLWEISSVRKNDNHPAKFPDELAERLVKMFSFPGDLVLDPCLGSGTTVKVAREHERIGVGYEQNLDYKPIILKKLKEANINE